MHYRRAEPRDRAQVLAITRDSASLDAPTTNTHVLEEDGQVRGVAIGSMDGTARLGSILLKDPARLDVFHELLLRKVEGAVAAGFQFGEMPAIRRRNMVELARRLYGVDPEPSGWDPDTGDPVEWTARAHLPTFLERLRALQPDASTLDLS